MSKFNAISDRVGYAEPRASIDWPTEKEAEELVQSLTEGTEEIQDEAFETMLRLIRFGKTDDGAKNAVRSRIVAAFMPAVQRYKGE